MFIKSDYVAIGPADTDHIVTLANEARRLRSINVAAFKAREKCESDLEAATKEEARTHSEYRVAAGIAHDAMVGIDRLAGK